MRVIEISNRASKVRDGDRSEVSGQESDHEEYDKGR